MLEMAASGSASSTVVQWGKAQAGTTSSYESMCFKGVWYSLYDNVFCRSGRTKPYVGKLMRLYEEQGVAKVRIRWFFRPEELPLFVRKDFPSDMLQSKELFIGLGSGVGVENENLVQVIYGKATVLCAARIKENALPSRAHFENADHFFNRAYNIGKKKLVKIGNILNKQLVEKMCNKREWMLPIEITHLHDTIDESCKASGASNEENISSALHGTIEESCKAVGALEEENISSALGLSNAKEVKAEVLHPFEKAQVSGDEYNLSASSSKKENLEGVVSITNFGGKKRILLKTCSTVPIVSLKKIKI